MTKVAIVTGSSRGIGAATARRLAGNGYAVCINYRHNRAAAEQVLDELEPLGTPAVAVKADVSTEEGVTHLFESVDKQLGQLNALVNNAGVLFRQMPVSQMTAERINAILTNNVTGAFLCCREAIKRMAGDTGGEGGSIVNVSSAAARLGSPGEYVDYAASKGAIDTLTRGLSVEVAEQGIRVNCVRPGFIYTDMHADGGEPNRVNRIKSALPMRRGGTPDEVAAAIVWLLSDEASYATGTFIDLAGGR